MRYLFVIFLAACGSGNDQPNDNHGYGFQFDVQSTTGMKLRGAADIHVLDVAYEFVEGCTGLSAPPPFVIIVAPHSLDDGQWNGAYWDDPPLVLLDPSEGDASKHEFIHYLQDVVQHVQDTNHTSPLFAKCQ